MKVTLTVEDIAAYLLQDFLDIPRNLAHLKELMMADSAAFQAAMEAMQAVVTTGFQQLSDHVQAETAQIVAALAAAASGGQAEMDAATQMVTDFSAGLQQRFQAIADSVDQEVP